MATDHRATLANIRRFDQLIAYLRDEMGWPVHADDFEELTFDYTPEELGIDAANAAKIDEIKRLRPLSANQPWGIFFVKFEPKRLPVVALRRILRQLVFKKRASANRSDRQAWHAHDLLFISTYGEGQERHICLSHFVEDTATGNLATLNVLGWDGRDTGLHLDHVADKLTTCLAWPQNEKDVDAWRERWISAFGLRHREVITTSQALAVRLAELARMIRLKVQSALAIETDKGKLRRLMKAFQESLIHDLKEDDFADMYAQTIAYGLLSARVTHQSEILKADDVALMVPLTNPFLRELMDTFLNLGGRKQGQSGELIDFDELGINDVVQTLRRADMGAVLRDFGDRNPQEDPVIHFYELFLREYDAKKRMQRGVFYTPRPAVSYIVRSVDELLRTEFGLEDGLADITTWEEMIRRRKDLKIPPGLSPDHPFVQILDPATGTGTFLVEVIDSVYNTMQRKWVNLGYSRKQIDETWNVYVPRHLLPRLHGYELLMAPYAIAHMKIGLKLLETGYRFESNERVRVYLTNALEPAQDFSAHLDFAVPALEHESHAVSDIKKRQRFTVVIGNPPYSSLSQNMGEWIRLLVKPFRLVKGIQIEEKGKRNHLQDDYVKFFRIALLQCETSGVGIVGLITNHGYLYSPTFRAMRYYMLTNATGCRVLDLNGNAKRDDAKRHPGDENLFEIQQGVAISVLWLNGLKEGNAVIEHGALFGSRAEKSLALAGSIDTIPLHRIEPSPEYYVFESGDISRPAEYDRWLKLDEVMSFGGTGIKTNRDHFVIDFDDEPIVSRMQIFRDKKLSDTQVQEQLGLSENYTWKISKQRRLFSEDPNHDRLRDVEYRPFDRRRIYYQRHVVYNPRFETMSQAGSDNVFLLLCRQQFDTGFRHVFVTRRMFECCLVSAKSREITSGFPLYVSARWRGGDVLFTRLERRPNLPDVLLRQMEAAIGVGSLADGGSGESVRHLVSQVFGYIYAILHSPGYRLRYAESLKMDFPRVPFTVDRDLFLSISRIGEQLVELHLMESSRLDKLTTIYIGPKNPPVQRVGWSGDTVWLDAVATKGSQQAMPGTVGFRGVPEAVWRFHVGGYQVCEKWLKDRKGRTLSDEDIAHYQRIVVALSETIRLMKEIDEVIETRGGWPGAFATGTEVNIPASGRSVDTGEILPLFAETSDGKEVGEYEGKVEPLQEVAVPKPACGIRRQKLRTEPAEGLKPVECEDLICLVRQCFSVGGARDRESAITELAGALRYQRVGCRIRKELDDAIRTAVRRGILEHREEELVLCSRSIEEYDRDFLKDQFLASLEGRLWTEREEAITGFARWLGFRRTGPSIDESARSLINGLLRDGRIEADGSRIRRCG